MHAESDFKHFNFDPQAAWDGLGAWLCDNHTKVMFVAEKDGQVVGMLAACLIATWFGSDVAASEELFFVHPEHRGSRAALVLMKSFCEWAKDAGAKHLRAGVATGTGKAAERLYQHVGMHYVGGNFSKHLQ